MAALSLELDQGSDQMVSAEQRKQDIINSISKNPTEISIDIDKKEVVDGSLKITKDTLELTVRIFQQKNPEAVVISDIKGTANTTKKYGMLVDHTAALLDTSMEDLAFDSPYGKMEVLAIYTQISRGEICGYQCELKRVS